MMRIVVCVRQGTDGVLGPFDAAAYELALRVVDAEVILLSMGPASAKEYLLSLTRLGARHAILLSDPAFAGADTLATAYTLTAAIKRLSPDLVLCGRQTLVGDTGQTGGMLAAMLDLPFLGNVMGINSLAEGQIACQTREKGNVTASLPAVLTVERVCELRLPRLRSRLGDVELWDAGMLGLDAARCGLLGSPTRVIETFENRSGKRRCKMISMEQLETAVAEGLRRRVQQQAPAASGERIGRVAIVGEAPRSYAASVSDDVAVLPVTRAGEIEARLREMDVEAVLFGSDAISKELAAQLAARLSLGLCADCTALSVEDGTMMMYRPALSGSLIAKIKSLTRPAMATVRTTQADESDVIVALGLGTKNCVEKGMALAKKLNASLGASRRMVDEGILPYDRQVGLTGKRVSPAVYVAIGISGAVHHIVGMERAGTVIAINKDPDAPIFEYADFGIVAEF